MSERVIGVARMYTPLDSKKRLHLHNLQYLLKVGLYSTHFAEEETEAQKGEKTSLYLLSSL